MAWWARDRDLPRAVWLPVLAAIVLFAVYLRFTGLAWGLRHPVHTDETSYVANVVRMLDARDFDNRFYQAPGLFFYLLAPAVAWLGPERWGSPDAYLVSRGVVAALGVLNVLLAFFVGSRLIGRWAGLAAALSLAVSPIDVQMSHQVRQDGVLQTFGLLAILAGRHLGPERRYDLSAGLVIGLATAIKFTGLLLVPSYLLARILAPGRRVRGILLAGAAGVGALLLSTPFFLVHLSRYVAGPVRVLRVYYPGGSEGGFFSHVALLVGGGLTTLGMAGSFLAVVGTAAALRSSWRAWLPPLLHPLTTILVLSTGNLVFERYLVPALGIVHLMVGFAIEIVARRNRLAAMLLAGVAVAAPARMATRYVGSISLPSAQDQALDWILSHLPAGARILETRPDA
ncbi:MAG TPA: glycosyltransferase family 39 protein, partial [Vicinamibacteria bacterium]|nr:glycosyltransferase family 39 protein [Vicinamibacteria bacterium]